MPAREKSFCEFFAGIGLVHEALRSGDWDCVYANDIDPKKAAMHAAHFGPTPYHVGDVWQADAVLEKIPGRPFLATASFPCTDMSLAGRMQGFQGGESSAFFGFCNVLEALGERQPEMVLLENVTGFLTSRGGDDFRTAASTLAGLGYFLDAWVLTAQAFTPQSRPRSFVLGVKESALSPAWFRRNTESPFDPWREAVLATPGLRSSRLLALMESTPLATGWVTRRLTDPPQVDYDLLAWLDTDNDQPWWDQSQVDRHYAMMSDAHRGRVEAWLEQGGRHVATVFRRMRKGEQRAEVRFDGAAGCLRTPRGGSARQIVLAAIDGRLRMRWMTPRECARLQGAPNFVIDVPDSQALFGFGDAVCVPVIEWIDQHLLTPTFQEWQAAHEKSRPARVSR
ncbi:DNA cytosine methyltransferase [Lignipirellula cremea]|uniref:DNA (cytosine-5-)-methyltransferase n=1 Tax=Lignipirellula cremea TaxID=2528010 RepID=A0A518E1F6_9BACT|nr:DNA (cytosine-5-)-methyltransferase [Lignipirellula cremea]QDU97929.1 Modification methylase HhaI [Lignipirellula cremea]